MNNTVIYKKESKLFLDIRVKELRVIKFVKKFFEAGLRTTLFLALVLSLITVITSNTDYLGVKSFTVLSGSMEPTIDTGSILYTHKNLGYNLRDIITFKTAAGMTVTHRIVGITSDGQVHYTTKGDANNAADKGTITNDMIIGKTYFAIPFIGKVSAILKDPKGLFAIVFFPSLIVIGYELWNIKKEIEKSVERRILEKIKHQGGAHTHSLWPESTS